MASQELIEFLETKQRALEFAAIAEARSIIRARAGVEGDDLHADHRKSIMSMIAAAEAVISLRAAAEADIWDAIDQAPMHWHGVSVLGVVATAVAHYDEPSDVREVSRNGEMVIAFARACELFNAVLSVHRLANDPTDLATGEWADAARGFLGVLRRSSEEA